MLKFWLTWLQPGLGLLGIGLLLSNALSVSAAPKLAEVGSTSHTSKQHSAKQSNRPAVSTLAAALSQQSNQPPSILGGISNTPDSAVRQLAINAMSMSGASTANLTAKVKVGNSSDAIANFLSPVGQDRKIQAFGSPKTQPAKRPIAIAASKVQPSSSVVVVPGLFIGNADIRMSSRFLPVSQPVATVPANRLVATTMPTAMMMSSSAIAEPFPVVRPERMQTLKSEPSVTIAKVPTAPAANNPIASITTGLQQLLGNQQNPSPATIAAPVAKAVAPKTNSLLALSQLVSPAPVVIAPVANGPSLQLATAQAYTSAAKFDIPGVMISQMPATKSVQFPSTVLTTKKVERNLTATVAKRQNNYVALMNDRTGANLTNKYFQIQPRQSWSAVNRSNQLGGLILGSPMPTTVSRGIALLPTDLLKPSFTNGMTRKSSAQVN